MSNPQLSIVVPVFNSSSILPGLYRRISDSLHAISHEVILVNDGSADSSWETIETLAADNRNILAVDLVKNSGQDNAILAGLRQVSGNFVVIIDDDLQHAPEDIPALYEKCLGGYDAVYGVYDNPRHNVLKKAGSRFNGAVARWLLNKPKNLYLSPFKIIRRNIVDEIARFCGPYPYIDGILLTITGNISHVKVEHYQRLAGKGNYNFYRSVSVFFRLFSGFSVAPLRIMTLAGLIIMLIGAGLILYYLYEHFILKDIVEGWTTIVVLIIFFGGITIMLLGLIGEYLGRIYLTLNNKPQYTIKKIIKNSDD
ncbi:MAG TPA: glycosyltransferase family 2 protein [Bacteroidales bacterium]|nr:glycosyltransferase family 2 protein [Bacteroidales bacterium]